MSKENEVLQHKIFYKITKKLLTDTFDVSRMVSYNIGHLAYLNAKRYGLSRVLFGGFFIRGHPYTMETISFAIKFWSKVSSCHILIATDPLLHKARCLIGPNCAWGWSEGRVTSDGVWRGRREGGRAGGGA